MANNITENPQTIDQTKQNAENGFSGRPLYEPSNTVEFNNSIAEKVYSGRNNTWIVLGRDRNSDLNSGFGGKGHSKAGAIDIVVGRLSAVDAKSLTDKKVNPSFSADAARIYISQKALIDEYFLIGNSNSSKSSPCSAIGIKADDIRIVARNSMKFVTRTDSFLSNNNPPYETMGIQLIANNDETTLQPIVLGTNLENALRTMNNNLANIIGHVQKFVNIQIQFNDALANHSHLSPFYAQQTSLDPKVIIEAKKAYMKIFTTVAQELLSETSNLVSWSSRFVICNGSDYINSKYNFSN